MRLGNTATTKPTSPATMERLIAAIKAEDANPTEVASALLRHCQAITPVKAGSTWRPERGLKVRYGVTLQFPKREAKFPAKSGYTPAMYRAYEACAKLAAKIAERDGRETVFGEAECNGKAVFDALCEEGIFEACGYAYPDGSGKASIRFAGEGTTKAAPVAETTLEDLGL